MSKQVKSLVILVIIISLTVFIALSFMSIVRRQLIADGAVFSPQFTRSLVPCPVGLISADLIVMESDT